MSSIRRSSRKKTPIKRRRLRVAGKTHKTLPNKYTAASLWMSEGFPLRQYNIRTVARKDRSGHHGQTFAPPFRVLGNRVCPSNIYRGIRHYGVGVRSSARSRRFQSGNGFCSDKARIDPSKVCGVSNKVSLSRDPLRYFSTRSDGEHGHIRHKLCQINCVAAGNT